LNELDQATTEIIATLTASAERIEAEALQSDQARGEAGQHEELVQTLRERLSALEREFNDGVPPALEPFVFVVDEDRDEVAVQQLRDQLQQLQQRLAPVPDDEPDEEEQLGFVVDEDEDEDEVEQLRAQGLQQRLGLVPNAGEGSSDSDDDLNDAQQLNEEEGFVVEDHFDDPELRRLPRLVTVPGDDGESSDSDEDSEIDPNPTLPNANPFLAVLVDVENQIPNAESPDEMELPSPEEPGVDAFTYMQTFWFGLPIDNADFELPSDDESVSTCPMRPYMGHSTRWIMVLGICFRRRRCLTRTMSGSDLEVGRVLELRFRIIGIGMRCWSGRRSSS
jgi:hypothetical protein